LKYVFAANAIIFGYVVVSKCSGFWMVLHLVI
jgi:hypothetical protein